MLKRIATVALTLHVVLLLLIVATTAPANAAGLAESANSCGAEGIGNSKIGSDQLFTTVCEGAEPHTGPTGSDPKDAHTDLASDEPDSTSEPGGQGGPSVCTWYTLDDRAGSARWAGHDPSQGHLEGLRCGATTDDGSGMGSNLLDSRFVANAAANQVPAQPPPPPDPAVLAQQAIGQLKVPPPAIGAGPERDKLAVNLWTWLWVNDPGAMTNTVATAGVSVTATATLASVTWSLGEPPDTGNGYEPGAPVSITCQGTGTAPAADYDWKAQPPCGYMFRWRSLKERTGGTGKWPITATSNWNVTWQSNTGVTGTTTLAGTSNDAFDIGEYRIVLVQQPGG